MSMKHWNIQISVQEVDEAEPPTQGRGLVPQPGKERVVRELLSVKVLARSEMEAYNKAIRNLQTNRPEPTAQATTVNLPPKKPEQI